jgi:Skp family chaperone for outer membrane proteins
MSMDRVKAAIKAVEAKRKVVNSLEAKEAAAIKKVKASYDEKFKTAEAELEKALADLDTVYKAVRNGGEVEENPVDEVEAEAV